MKKMSLFIIYIAASSIFVRAISTVIDVVTYEVDSNASVCGLTFELIFIAGRLRQNASDSCSLIENVIRVNVMEFRVIL